MNDCALEARSGDAARRADVMAALLKHCHDALGHCDSLRRSLRAATDKPESAIPVELMSQVLIAELEAAPWRELHHLGLYADPTWGNFARILPQAISRTRRHPAPPPGRTVDLVYTADAVVRSKAMNQFLATTAEARALIAEEESES